jgi:hypothetical protein
VTVLVCYREGCNREFTRTTSQKYCTVDCRKADRKCPRCGVSAPDAPGTKPNYCNECMAARARDYRKGDKYKARWSANHRFAVYGLTVERYLDLLESQNGVCAICARPETAKRGGQTKTLAVDHDHKTGLVRGLLCQSCNTAIGLMNDDPQRMAAAIDYLGIRR